MDQDIDTSRYVIGADVAEGLDVGAQQAPDTEAPDAADMPDTEAPDADVPAVDIGDVLFLSDESPCETRATTRKITIPLSDDEKLELGDEIVEKQKQIDNIEALKKRIPGLREEMSALSMRYRDGLATLDVPCTAFYDFPSAGRKTIVRDDTREVVEISDMNEEEMQGNLPFDGTLPATAKDETTENEAAENVYTIPENPDNDADPADAEMEEGYGVAAVERED